jgi:hypothetical protein
MEWNENQRATLADSAGRNTDFWPPNASQRRWVNKVSAARGAFHSSEGRTKVDFSTKG